MSESQTQVWCGVCACVLTENCYCSGPPTATSGGGGVCDSHGICCQTAEPQLHWGGFRPLGCCNSRPCALAVESTDAGSKCTGCVYIVLQRLSLLSQTQHKLLLVAVADLLSTGGLSSRWKVHHATGQPVEQWHGGGAICQKQRETA
jgi:hypothetical protein